LELLVFFYDIIFIEINQLKHVKVNLRIDLLKISIQLTEANKFIQGIVSIGYWIIELQLCQLDINDDFQLLNYYYKLE